jgi:hypothetical protein
MSETKARPKRTSARATTAPEPTREAIAARAYEIAHGEDGGSEEENWLRAERELRAEPT